MNKDELKREIAILPVGSIVYLKDAKQAIIIIGFGVIEEGKTKVWDYLGAPWPMGVLASDRNLLFNNEQIDKVVAEGYSDDDEVQFRLRLEEKLAVLKVD